MKAKYTSHCPVCKKKILTGTEIVMHKKKARHARCAPKPHAEPSAVKFVNGSKIILKPVREGDVVRGTGRKPPVDYTESILDRI